MITRDMNAELRQNITIRMLGMFTVRNWANRHTLSVLNKQIAMPAAIQVTMTHFLFHRLRVLGLLSLLATKVTFLVVESDFERQEQEQRARAT